MRKIIYKISPKKEWAKAKVDGLFLGSEHDKRDGFIHFSEAHQLAGTLEKHYAQQKGLLLIAVASDKVDSPLKFEPSRDGDLFPHLYGPLCMDAVLWDVEIELDECGLHKIPEGVC